MTVRTYTEAQHKAELEAALAAQRATANERAWKEFMTEERSRWESHNKSHETMANALVEIREDIRNVVVITDPKLREAAPKLLAEMQRERENRGERRAFWNTWKGVTTVVVAVGGFIMVSLTSLGVLPPKPAVPPTIIASPTPSHTP